MVAHPSSCELELGPLESLSGVWFNWQSLARFGMDRAIRALTVPESTSFTVILTRIDSIGPLEPARRVSELIWRSFRGLSCCSHTSMTVLGLNKGAIQRLPQVLKEQSANSQPPPRGHLGQLALAAGGLLETAKSDKSAASPGRQGIPRVTPWREPWIRSCVPLVALTRGYRKFLIAA